MSILFFFLFLIPVGAQGVAMFVDEFYFHRKRGLPQWERLGHPVDSFFVLLPLSLTLLFEFNLNILLLYVVLALFSSLLVTKDEFVHSRLCEPAENWLHAMLFVLHPLVFLVMGLLWIQRDTGALSAVLPPGAAEMSGGALIAQVCAVLGFLVYQVLYWNVYAKKNNQ